MTRTVPISELRDSLFDLFDAVVEHAGDRVYIMRRGYADRAVLLSAAYLEQLERRVNMLRETVTAMQKQTPESTFKLIGSATLLVPPEDVLKRTRARQAELETAKRKGLRG